MRIHVVSIFPSRDKLQAPSVKLPLVYHLHTAPRFAALQEQPDHLIKKKLTDPGKVARQLAGGGIQAQKLISDKNELLLKLNECSDTLFHHRKIDVKQLARLMHMSRPTLYRKLKGVMELTPNEWINETRMKRAAELLAEGQYKASQVARLLGFTSQSSFGKKFLKQFKVTPATYQRMEVMTRQL